MERRASIGLDHLCNLPDEILYSVLSMLPTKEAVATSILCRRCRSLWTCMPKLHLARDMVKCTCTGRQCSCDWWLRWTAAVDRLVKSRARPILCLEMSNEEDTIKQVYINELMVSFKEKGISKFILYFPARVGAPRRSSSEYPPFPVKLFGCETLTVLELGKCTFNFPPAWKLGFPRLKTFKAVLVKFEKDSFARLLDGSEFLENLIMVYCSGLREVEIRAARLRRLHILSLFLASIDLKGAPKVEDFSGAFSQGPHNWFNCPMNKLLKDLATGVKRLCLSQSSLESCSSLCTSMRPKNVKFYDLRRLCIELDLQRPTHSATLFWLLESSPNLQTLVVRGASHLVQSLNCEKINPRNYLEMQGPFPFQTNSLTKVQMSLTHEFDLEFARHMLMNSSALKKMIILHDSHIVSRIQQRREAELMALKRASPSAVVEFPEKDNGWKWRMYHYFLGIRNDDVLLADLHILRSHHQPTAFLV